MISSNGHAVKGCIHILVGIGAIVFFFYFAIDDFKHSDAIADFRLMTEDTREAIAVITDAEEIEVDVEIGNHRETGVKYVTAYNYSYTFHTIDGRNIEISRSDYGSLPLNKDISDLPYEVDVKYLFIDPMIHNFGLWTHETSLLEWFRKNLLLKLIAFAFVFFFARVYIIGGIKDWKGQS